MDEIIVIGGGGHSKVVISILRKSGYEVIGYTDKEDRGRILGVRHLGIDDALPDIALEHPGCVTIVGVGKVDASPLRLRLQDDIEALGFEFPAVWSVHAVVNEEVSMGAGTIAMDGAIVSAGTKLGRACILNSGSIVEHDCRIGDNVHIAPGATLSGGVTIGDHCLVGTGAKVIHAVQICAGCVIGAGATVIADIEVPGTYVGTPARKLG
jgi:sugar O-acyltransferase (sialic acid O-acetyltransferase NeuD family)